jgi:hypothetical protein
LFIGYCLLVIVYWLLFIVYCSKPQAKERADVPLDVMQGQTLLVADIGEIASVACCP